MRWLRRGFASRAPPTSASCLAPQRTWRARSSGLPSAEQGRRSVHHMVCASNLHALPSSTDHRASNDWANGSTSFHSAHVADSPLYASRGGLAEGVVVGGCCSRAPRSACAICSHGCGSSQKSRNLTISIKCSSDSWPNKPGRRAPCRAAWRTSFRASGASAAAGSLRKTVRHGGLSETSFSASASFASTMGENCTTISILLHDVALNHTTARRTCGCDVTHTH